MARVEAARAKSAGAPLQRSGLKQGSPPRALGFGLPAEGERKPHTGYRECVAPPKVRLGGGGAPPGNSRRFRGSTADIVRHCQGWSACGYCGERRSGTRRPVGRMLKKAGANFQRGLSSSSQQSRMDSRFGPIFVRDKKRRRARITNALRWVK